MAALTTATQEQDKKEQDKKASAPTPPPRVPSTYASGYNYGGTTRPPAATTNKDPRMVAGGTYPAAPGVSSAASTSKGATELLAEAKRKAEEAAKAQEARLREGMESQGVGADATGNAYPDLMGREGTVAPPTSAIPAPPPSFGETLESVQKYMGDPYADEELYPPALWNTPAQDAYGTAEPATDEEKSLFDEESFQFSALTFGLTLLLGGSIEDAVSSGAQAFAEKEYIKTPEYAELRADGVPHSVIRQAYRDNKWDKVQVYQKEAKQQRQWEATNAINARDRREDRMFSFAEKAYEQSQKDYAAAMKAWRKNANSVKGDKALQAAFEANLKTQATEAQALNNVNKEINAFKPYKDIDKMTPIEQYALQYRFLKDLDSQSVVRPQEIENFMRTSTLYNKLVLGIKNITSFDDLDLDLMTKDQIDGIRNFVYKHMLKNRQKHITNIITLDNQNREMGYAQKEHRAAMVAANIYDLSGKFNQALWDGGNENQIISFTEDELTQGAQNYQAAQQQ